jgi:anti-sigma regulatory factor (Ser/Thr protein kinase)
LNISRQTSCLATPSSLATLLDFLDATCKDAALSEDVCFAVRLAGEEACCNVIDHAYSGGEPGPISLELRCEQTQVVLVIEDRAPFFSPADAPSPDLTADLESRRLGGLGWHLIHQMMDEVKHERRPEGGNRLELVKRLATAPAN